MKKYILIILIIIFDLPLLKEAKSQSENFIIAKIDKKIITSFDIKNKILGTLIISQKEINQENINNLKEKTLETLVNLRLKEIELEKFNLEVDSQKVNSYLKQILKNNISSIESIFKNYDLDFNLLKQEIETELKWRQFIFETYSKRINIDEKTINYELKKLLNTSANTNNSMEVNLSEIEVFQSKNISNNETIKKILQEIEINGFENTALKFSISDSSSAKGKLGWVNINALSKKIINTIKDMEINQISDPIIGDDNILFLKLNNKRKINKKIDEVKLKKILIQEKQNQIFDLYAKGHLSKLKNNTLIIYK